mgnify:CR=1 FL=1
MPVQYVDINAANSSIANSNNNIWTYQLNEGLELPTNTNVSIQSSFINKKGITGGSIEISEDIEEEVLFNYYGVDTDYQGLVQEPQTGTDLQMYNLYQRYSDPINSSEAPRYYTNKDDMTHTGFSPVGTKYNLVYDNVGRSENRMPFVFFVKNDTTGDLRITPATGKQKIRIPKGTYTISQIAQLIEDQFNGKKQPDNFGESFLDNLKDNNAYRGLLQNLTTNRIVRTQEPFYQPATKYTPTMDVPANGVKNAVPFWTALFTYDDAVPSTNISTGHALTGFLAGSKFSDQIQTKETYTNVSEGFGYTNAMTRDDYAELSALMITPHHYEMLRQGYTKSDAVNVGEGAASASSDIYNFFKKSAGNEFGLHRSTNKLYYQGFSANRNTMAYNFDQDKFHPPPSGLTDYSKAENSVFFQKLAPDEDSNVKYNIFDVGVPIGAMDIQVSYNDTASGFSFQRLHNPVKFPTHDRFGNDLSGNAGKEGLYMKRIKQGNFMRYQYLKDCYLKPDLSNLDITTLTDSAALVESADYFDLNNTIQNIMSRTGGIQIFNWSLGKAKELGDRVLENDSTDELRTFGEYFTTKEAAREAFKKTLWGRLGFSYDQLQNEDRWKTENWYYGTQKTNGFTTDQTLDTSTISTISTIFNSYNTNDTKQNQFGPLPTLKAAGIQLFQSCDVNIPNDSYNNNTAGATSQDFQLNTAAYQNSDYLSATMFPIITVGGEEIAEALPTLSTHGYYIISSDVVATKDIVKTQDPLPILDIVPISSLSNQDFITDKNQIIHSMTNPRVLNSITIKVLHPDLTSPSLEPNSSILLKIDYPDEVPTQLIDNAQRTIEENEITQNVAKIDASIQKQQEKASQK